MADRRCVNCGGKIDPGGGHFFPPSLGEPGFFACSAFKEKPPAAEPPAPAQPPAFSGFPKIPRLNRPMVVTEKIDGTNASILITESGDIFAGSRNRWITPEQDNMGFARWVADNKDELVEGLGPGHHFGEWWGAGIQRRYGLDHKRFSLFNVGRWHDLARRADLEWIGREQAPQCCHVVPIITVTTFCTEKIAAYLAWLRDTGSIAAPGYMQPEGIVVYHQNSGLSFKVTCERDESPKSYATPA